MKARIYMVVAKLGDVTKPHLIKAISKSQAEKCISKSIFTTRVATQDDLIHLLPLQNEVIDAAKEERND